MALQTWQAENFPTLPQEQAIWANWNLQIPQTLKNLGISHNSSTVTSKWTPPPPGTFKLNFDGASKGNPGRAGFGGIFRDHEGKPLLLYMGNIGWDTNNSAELEGMRQGLSLSHIHGFHPLEIEGDSQILINMANQLLQGAHANKVANSWRLEARLGLIEQWLNTNRALLFKHVKRDGNKVAELLANMGVDSEHTLLVGSLNIIHDYAQLQECNTLVQNDVDFPDAGVQLD